MKHTKNKKKNKKRRVNPEIEKIQTRIGPLWKFALWESVLGCFLLTLGACSASWVVLDPIKYNYYGSSTPTRIAVGYTYLGLYLTYYDVGKYITSWSERVSKVCNVAEKAASQGGGDGMDFLTTCSSNCVIHWGNRCSVYKFLSTIGFIFLALLILCATAGLAASIWLLMFSKSTEYLKMSYYVAGAFGFLGSICFYFVCQYQFSTLRNSSVWPGTNPGYSFYVSTIGGGLLLISGLLVSYASQLDEKEINEIVEAEIIQKEAAGISYNAAPGIHQPVSVAPVKFAIPAIVPPPSFRR